MINKVTKVGIIKWKDINYTAGIVLASVSSSWEAPIWRLPHMSKGISRREEEYSLQPNKANMLKIKLDHFDKISFIKKFGRIGVAFLVVFFYKIRRISS